MKFQCQWIMGCILFFLCAKNIFASGLILTLDPNKVVCNVSERTTEGQTCDAIYYNRAWIYCGNYDSLPKTNAKIAFCNQMVEQAKTSGSKLLLSTSRVAGQRDFLTLAPAGIDLPSMENRLSDLELRVTNLEGRF